MPVWPLQTHLDNRDQLTQLLLRNKRFQLQDRVDLPTPKLYFEHSQPMLCAKLASLRPRTNQITSGPANMIPPTSPNKT